ncbi:GNAT family N-acetyltransferase [Riemerella anatipestifer]|uniref:Gcn5-like N-acetyltransferase n=1 Tax=Riemerella anatipestifer TaxID=34085 RepID=A0A1S7DTJ8_RIEAN|nr:GNAT family N-acetyltransferase [Riemerella anatipestifer]AQY22436.1 Gcn5-like N-acetyltransferase [Riemerella anatipestifer]MCO4303465.1 GNAT family N-acetyltransferase [Riemerella anatipestifer]MCO7352424.1 GNAT family N-acetyltransferase [Riemerella anatipestifer]MCQ4038717.1 GNAT family N-acetyltransferase [Riemerella anatipestifer]MCT6760401.1 GNAT family N-acetyltransferase [Riemerella anatipestifer]
MFQPARIEDIDIIWEMLQQGIRRRKEDGSNQWQDGYPNRRVVEQDIRDGVGYVWVQGDEVLGYAALMLNNEPAYDNIEGEWLSNGDYVVVHRVVVHDRCLGKGIAKQMFLWVEGWAKQQNIYSIKVDTNYDNQPMLHILQHLGYQYCGEVYFRGSPRKAFEKVLK